MTGLSTALQSGSILLREGLEALLVIAMLAAFLTKAGEATRVRWLYAGALLAVAASIVAAVLFETYYGGAHDDRVEALVMAVAAALMLYMSGWLFLRQDPKAWSSELKRKAEAAITTGTALSMAALAFLAVFREGAETVLFLHAAAKTAGGWGFAMLAGLAGAAVLLVAIYVAMQWLALRLPLRPVFVATSAFLFMMALRFAGAAVQELQEQALVPFHEARLPEWLVEIGVGVTWEALGLQVALALLAIASTVGLEAMRKRA